MNPRNWVVPASFFSIVLGLVGLGSDWRVATRLWNLPSAIGEIILLIAALVWALLVLLYACKWAWHRDAAVAEVNHPIQCCFIALLPVSTALVALAAIPYSRPAAICLFVPGVIGTIAFLAWRHGGLWQGGRVPAATTPALYLSSPAGNFVAAIVAGALGWPDWGRVFFGAGLLAWLMLESVVLYRLFVAEPLAVPLRPTLGIQIAPPAVGLVAYLSVTEGDPGLFAQILLGYALLQGLILLRLLPWIGRQKFSAGYWAFTFGVAALALGAERMADRGVTGPAAELAPILFVIANLAIGAVAIGSIVLLARGELLPSTSVKTDGSARPAA